MQKALKILRWIFTMATVGIILLLSWQCLDIYLVGNRPENIVGGVYLTQVYSAQIVSERLAKISPLIVFYVVLAAVTVMAQLFFGTPQRTVGKIRPCPPRAQSDKTVRITRFVLLCLGALFIILGIKNGGSRDVLIKAINICTECIGLG